VDVLREFGFSAEAVSPEPFLRENKVVRMGLPPLRIDLLTSASGVDFASCQSRHVLAEIDGVPVRVVGLEDLKANKRASGRAKDLADLENLP
jgi:hypothetical protein